MGLDKIALGVTLLVGLLGGVAVMNPEWHWVGVVMIAFCGAGLLGLAIHQCLDGMPSLRWGYMPLNKAAAHIYGRTRKTEIAQFAEHGDGTKTTPDGILNWYAYWMRSHGVRIFGQRPPSTQRELVPKAHDNRLHFKEGASALYQSYADGPEFIKLEVLRSDLRKHRNKLESLAGGDRDSA